METMRGSWTPDAGEEEAPGSPGPSRSHLRGGRGGDTAGSDTAGNRRGGQGGRRVEGAGRALNINSSDLPAKSDQSTFHMVMDWTTDPEAPLSLSALLLLPGSPVCPTEAVSSWINLQGADTGP